MKKILLFFTLFALGPLFSECCPPVCLGQVYMSDEVGVRTPAASATGGWSGLLVVGDFLYWTAREEVLEYAFNGNRLSGTTARGNIKVEEPDFEWDPGFRVGLGYRIPLDFWEAKARWTRFQTEASGTSFNPSGLGNFSIWTDGYAWNETTMTHLIQAKWHLTFNLAEVGLSRSFFLGKNIALDFQFGGVGGWISQRYNMECPNEVFSNGTIQNLSLKFKNDFRGGGIFLALSPQWYFLNSLSCICDFNAYLLRGNFSLNQNWIREQQGISDMSLAKDYSRSRAALRSSFGFQWETDPQNCWYHLAFSASYEGFIWFKQNLWSQVISYYMENIERRGDLVMQGLSLSAQIDF